VFGVVVLAFPKDSLAKRAPVGEPEAAKQCLRGLVVRDRPSVEAMEAERTEGVIAKQRRGFGRVAPSPVVGTQPVRERAVIGVSNIEDVRRADCLAVDTHQQPDLPVPVPFSLPPPPPPICSSTNDATSSRFRGVRNNRPSRNSGSLRTRRRSAISVSSFSIVRKGHAIAVQEDGTGHGSRPRVTERKRIETHRKPIETDYDRERKALSWAVENTDVGLSM